MLGVATVVVSRWEGELDMDRARRVLTGFEEEKLEEEESEPLSLTESTESQ